MAKKAPNKVVVNEDYYELLVAKAEMLDGIFGDEDGHAIIPASGFKDFEKITKAFDKLPEGATDVEEYTSSAEAAAE